jgi:hypothetical protein
LLGLNDADSGKSLHRNMKFDSQLKAEPRNLVLNNLVPAGAQKRGGRATWNSGK